MLKLEIFNVQSFAKVLDLLKNNCIYQFKLVIAS